MMSVNQIDYHVKILRSYFTSVPACSSQIEHVKHAKNTCVLARPLLVEDFIGDPLKSEKKSAFVEGAATWLELESFLSESLLDGVSSMYKKREDRGADCTDTGAEGAGSGCTSTGF